MPQLSMHSPVGDLTLTEEGGALVAIDWGWSPIQAETPLLHRAKAQLEEYFDGTRRSFDLLLAPAGTAFQKSVWRAMQAIPAGSTRTYGDLAADLRSAPRAVGQACGRNPLPIVIPCHRVLGSNGAIGGYSGEGGLDTKRDLLRLEGVPLSAG
jgi:methylated-DNA-[protein]-cysteine S-methyltransferase